MRLSAPTYDPPLFASVLDDIRSIVRAMRMFPVPRRARDFRLSRDDAMRLRRFAWSVRLRVALRSLAASMSAAGIVLAVVTAPLAASAPSVDSAVRQEVAPMGAPPAAGDTYAQSDPAGMLGDAPSFLVVGGLGLFLLQWGTERAGRPSRRR